MWDDLIQDHVENIKQVEEELIESHQEELRRFDEEIEKIVIPKPKFSKELLDNRHILQKLVNAKQYSDAQQVSDKIEQMVHLSPSDIYTDFVRLRRERRRTNGTRLTKRDSSRRSSCWCSDRQTRSRRSVSRCKTVFRRSSA